MAKTSSIVKNNKRFRKVLANLVQRKKLQVIVKTSEGEEQLQAIKSLNTQPRDRSPVRLRLRCLQCGRPRGTLRRFRLCRICFRQLAMKGDVPGLKKSSR